MHEAVRQVRAELPAHRWRPPPAEGRDTCELTVAPSEAPAVSRGGSSPDRAVAPWASARRWAAVIAAAAAVALAGAVALPRLRGPREDTRTAAKRPVVGPARAPGAEEAARAYLDEAERLLQSRRFGAAADLLARARAQRITDPALDIRLIILEDQLATPTALLKAESLLAAGDARQAVEIARRVLARDPQSLAAQQIIASARRAKPPSQPHARQARAAARREAPAPAPLASEEAPGSAALGAEPPAASPEPLAAPAAAAHPRPMTPPPRSAPPAAPPPLGPGLANDADIVSERPKAMIPAPHLPRSYQASDGQDLARICQLVESETVSQAGVTAEFARGVTAPLRRALGGAGGVRISPSAIYYFIVTEAGRGHDKRTAAQRLLSAESELMHRLSTLPALQPKL
jgi:hypothetical protein